MSDRGHRFTTGSSETAYGTGADTTDYPHHLAPANAMGFGKSGQRERAYEALLKGVSLSMERLNAFKQYNPLFERSRGALNAG